MSPGSLPKRKGSRSPIVKSTPATTSTMPMTISILPIPMFLLYGAYNGPSMKHAAFLVMLAMNAKPAVKIEKKDYKGWPNSYWISNGEVELVITTDIGPRIMRYGFTGGQNVFKEFP